MQRIKKSTKMFILTLLMVLCCFAGLFFVFQKKQEPMKADAAEVITGFYMEEGMALMRTPNKPYVGLTVYITQDMYNKLSEKTTSSTVLGNTSYHPSQYYLRVEAFDSNKELLMSVNYHIDPEHSVFSSNQLVFSTDHTWARIEFPIICDFEAELTYKCKYVYETRNMMSSKPGPQETIKAESSSTVTRSVGYVARMALQYEEDLTLEETNWLNHLAGNTAPEGEFTVNLKYKRLLGYAQIEETVKSYSINSLYAFYGEMVYSNVLLLHGGDGIATFNAVYKDPYNGNGKIFLQADSYTYSFNDSTDIGTLTITYRDFDYANFAIRLQDNDWNNESNLYLYVYTSDVSYDEERVFLTFTYSSIVDECYSSLTWLFNLNKNNFVVSNNSSGVSVYIGDNSLKVAFYPSAESELQNLSIMALAEIIPDYACSVTFEFIELDWVDGRISDGWTSLTVDDMMYSQYVKYCNWDYFRSTGTYNTLAVTPLKTVGAIGQLYCIPESVTGTRNNDGSFTLKIGYDHTTLFEFLDEEGNARYAACTKNSLTYDKNDLPVIAPASDRRLSSLTTQDVFATVNFREDAADDFTIRLNIPSNSFNIITFNVSYSFSWYLNIEYMETYKETPFALKKVYQTEINVASYDIDNLTLKDIKSIMGRSDSMEVCGLVIPDNKVEVEYTNTSTYTARLSYGQLSLSAIDYDGTKIEIRVPLTKYEDWCKTFGDDLSILYLNRGDKKYFDYSNEVPREDLYGFFTVAVFEEQVSDLNYYFRDNTGKGNIVVFERRTATGSVVYQFFDNLRSKGPLLAAAGYSGMAFCEIVNDNNKVLYSVFLYLDASDAYISDGGATDKDDTDDALDNKVDSVIQDITSRLEKPADITRIALAAIIGTAAVCAIVWGVVWFVRVLKDTANGSIAAGNSRPNSNSNVKPKKKQKSGKKSPKKKNKR